MALAKGEFVFQIFILAAIYVLAFATRLFSVLRYESVIHEFDPYFNFRSTKKLVSEGFYAFHNWTDELTWFPYGRLIGATLYPGLMLTAAFVYHTLNFLNVTVNIRNVCVMLAPFMASNTSIAAYLLTKEIWSPSAGLFAAAFISIVPGYTSRSVAGSYDNEAVAIFAIVFTFYLWVKAVNTGSMSWASAAALSYFYMVASWGGYIFLINVIPFHVLVLLLCGRYSSRLYVAYSTFYVLGTLMSMMITMVGFLPVNSPEHMGAMGVFGLVQLYQIYLTIKSYLSPAHMKVVLRFFFFFVLPSIFLLLVLLMMMGYFPRLTGRLLALLGSTTNIAIVKSVSEHQPTPWSSFFFDMNILTLLMPAGLYFCYAKLSDATLFIVLYVLFSSYFSGIMIRLVLVYSPGACCLGAIAASETLHSLISGVSFAERYSLNEDDEEGSRRAKSQKKSETEEGEDAEGDASSSFASLLMVLGFAVLFAFYVIHCSWVTSMAYSSPSIVLQANQHDGSRIIFDDFREAYFWLRHNTDQNAKIMSWWDYGYQITAMGNRTTIVDNNTRNNTHIATVGYAMSSTEEKAYPVLKRLDVDYVLVVFGGMVGYASDDINKFLWMIRIGGGTFPEVVEEDYYNSRSEFRVDSDGSPTLLNSLMYKMCFYRFGEAYTEYGQQPGFDRVRRAVIGNRNISFKHLEEAYTTEHWMVRIYRVIKERDVPAAITTYKAPNKRKSAVWKKRAERRKALQTKRRERRKKLKASKRK